MKYLSNIKTQEGRREEFEKGSEHSSIEISKTSALCPLPSAFLFNYLFQNFPKSLRLLSRYELEVFCLRYVEGDSYKEIRKHLFKQFGGYFSDTDRVRLKLQTGARKLFIIYNYERLKNFFWKFYLHGILTASPEFIDYICAFSSEIEAALSVFEGFSLDKYELSRKTLDYLHRNQIFTVRDLLSKSFADLVAIKNLGRHSLRRLIEDIAQEFGFSSPQNLCQLVWHNSDIYALLQKRNLRLPNTGHGYYNHTADTIIDLYKQSPNQGVSCVLPCETQSKPIKLGESEVPCQSKDIAITPTEESYVIDMDAIASYRKPYEEEVIELIGEPLVVREDAAYSSSWTRGIFRLIG